MAFHFSTEEEIFLFFLCPHTFFFLSTVQKGQFFVFVVTFDQVSPLGTAHHVTLKIERKKHQKECTTMYILTILNRVNYSGVTHIVLMITV